MIQIRPMSAEDAGAAAEISRHCLEESWDEKDFCESLERDYTALFAAEKDGAIIGYAVFYLAADQAELVSIAVIPEERQCKAATEIMENSLRNVYDRGVRLVTLEVRESNIPARRLYEKFHFEILGKRKRFYQNPQEDALILGSNLP